MLFFSFEKENLVKSAEAESLRLRWSKFGIASLCEESGRSKSYPHLQKRDQSTWKNIHDGIEQANGHNLSIVQPRWVCGITSNPDNLIKSGIALLFQTKATLSTKHCPVHLQSSMKMIKQNVNLQLRLDHLSTSRPKETKAKKETFVANELFCLQWRGTVWFSTILYRIVSSSKLSIGYAVQKDTILIRCTSAKPNSIWSKNFSKMAVAFPIPAVTGLLGKKRLSLYSAFILLQNFRLVRTIWDNSFIGKQLSN